MICIGEGIREWIIKDRCSFFERDTMLNEITSSFLLIPGKAHVRTIAAVYPFLLLKQTPKPKTDVRPALLRFSMINVRTSRHDV